MPVSAFFPSVPSPSWMRNHWVVPSSATAFFKHVGALSVYRPLVIDHGTSPAAPPIVSNMAPGSVVGVWFGFQGDTLTLDGATGSCINGLRDSLFGQFAYCGAPDFFRAANTAISQGKLTVPPLATSRDGQPCPPPGISRSWTKTKVTTLTRLI